MIVAHFDGDRIGPRLELLLLEEQLEEATAYSNAVERAMVALRDSLVQHVGAGAMVYVCGGDDLIVSFPDESISMGEIEKLRQEFRSLCGQSISVGIGASARSAVHSLRRAKLLGGDRIISDVHVLR
jgi:GTP cyclohydrolase III